MSLSNAWGTEFLLLASKKFAAEDEIIRLSNNWSCIQTYYIFYHCTQALIIAKGQKRPENHTKTQNIFFALWAGRSINLPPWTLACGHDGFLNVPSGIDIVTNKHQWSACFDENDYWNLACKALKTTRNEVIPERIKNHRERNKNKEKKKWFEQEQARLAQGKRNRKPPPFTLPRLTAAEKQTVHANVRPYTIMDYLYRLRIKTNYVDANMFVDGPENNQQSTDIRNYLCALASNTAFIHELAVSQIIGKKIFSQWVNDWVSNNIPADMNDGLKMRISFFDN